MDTLERLEALLENYQTLVEHLREKNERLEEENERLQEEIAQRKLGSQQMEDQWNKLQDWIQAQDTEIERLRQALTECAADFDLKVKSYEAAYEIISHELKRRFTIARIALQQGDKK